MVRNPLGSWLSSSSPDLDKLLRVPFDYQPESEDECVIYGLWMIIHYFKNKHPNDAIRSETNALSPDELMEDMTIVKGGWRPDQDELTLVSKRTRTLQFHLNYWQDGAPKPLFEYITENVEEDRPVIPFVNGPQLRQGKRDNDGVHAVVVSGYGTKEGGEDVIAFHDPWGYPEDIKERPKLEDAWDPMFNQIITVTLSNKGEKIEGESQ